jgi:hypothetical protein
LEQSLRRQRGRPTKDPAELRINIPAAVRPRTLHVFRHAAKVRGQHIGLLLDDLADAIEVFIPDIED